MTLALNVTATGDLTTACHGCWPWGRSPFAPLHRTLPTMTDDRGNAAGAPPLRAGWRAVATVGELEALRAWGPWCALICHLCCAALVLS